MSFFTKYKTFALELVSDNQFVKSNEKSVFPVFNFGEWKLNSNSTKSQLNVMKENLAKFETSVKSIDIPFGCIVSSPQEVHLISKLVNFLYVPGELCRQSDILEACQQTHLPIFVEKGSFLAPSDLQRVIEKLKNSSVAIIETGNSFGYSDVTLDPRSLYILRSFGIPFGIHLAKLCASEEQAYSHKPHWLHNTDFISAFVDTGKGFGVNFYVIDNQKQLKVLSTFLSN
ncbi:hypothetical protein QEJ31_13780 [Pigmentibacter sp. JX0631]|uniref:hypothetical protein n=1 Tax=Pigmentibacter sp. JX0631 TaxID=2976982 RepID=UPI00246914ED|nr:hypothetical protein [Pigmentibacter sp. JX0631]WGL59596.1 hypothetical protein QEJ31_13780 [Pigmentibacter sp. JX0631]